MREFVIQKNDVGLRLDKFVGKVTTNLSGPLLYKYLRKKAIKVNGKKKEISYRLQENDVVMLYINDEFFCGETPQFLKVLGRYQLDIIYEDDNILLLDKKPGLLVHEDETGVALDAWTLYFGGESEELRLHGTAVTGGVIGRSEYYGILKADSDFSFEMYSAETKVPLALFVREK